MADDRTMNMMMMNNRRNQDDAPRRPRLSAWRCVLLALLSPLLVSCGERSSNMPVTASAARAKASATQAVTINHLKFNMELALTRDEREQGLSDRTSIDEKGGMLFVFPEPTVVGFVMRRCLVPIDIIFAKEDGTITAMYEMKVQPYYTKEEDLKKYSSHAPVLFALEFKGGTLAKLGLKLGDKLDLPSPDLKARAR